MPPRRAKPANLLDHKKASVSVHRNGKPVVDPLERFWLKVSPDETGCWLWSKSTFPDGYGQFKIGDKNWRAHRWIYLTLKGDIPDGMMIMHTCDTPRCVNPQHLLVGTHQENQRDSVIKGRRNSHVKRRIAETGKCLKGLHAMDEANTYVAPRGNRCCRECVRISQRNRLNATKA